MRAALLLSTGEDVWEGGGREREVGGERPIVGWAGGACYVSQEESGSEVGREGEGDVEEERMGERERERVKETVLFSPSVSLYSEKKWQCHVKWKCLYIPTHPHTHTHTHKIT